MEEKLVKVLLDQYKEKGIDMYALLDNGFFKGLGLNQKVDLIKKYASHISSGTSRTLTKSDIAAISIDAGIAGALTGVTAGLAAREAGKYFTKGITPLGTIVGAVALGAAMSAGSSYMGSRRLIKQREEILKKIDRTAANPTDENALSILATRDNQLNPFNRISVKSNAVERMTDTAKQIPSRILDQVGPVAKYFSFKHNGLNQTNDYAEGVTTEEFMHNFEQSKKDMIDSLNRSSEEMKRTILGTR